MNVNGATETRHESMLSALREATADAHAALDRRLALADVTRPRSTTLTSRGERTSASFRELVAKIEAWALDASPAARTSARRAARATFATYTHAFEAMGAFAG